MDKKILRNSSLIAVLIGLIAGTVIMVPIMVVASFTMLGNMWLFLTLGYIWEYWEIVLPVLFIFFGFLLWQMGKRSAKECISQKSNIIKRSLIMSFIVNTAMLGVIVMLALINLWIANTKGEHESMLFSMFVLILVYFYNLFLSVFSYFPLINFIIKKYISSKLSN